MGFIKRSWIKKAGLLAAAAFLLFAFGWVPYFLGGIATTRRFQYNDRENAGLTPASFDLKFEEVSFNARDGVPLSGWWVPATDARGTVVLVHGLNRSRIEMVRKTPFLNRKGWNALLFDLRHHGKSGGTVSSFGHYEKQDVQAAADWARARSSGPVVLWGVSLGGASAALAAAEDPSVAALVCDSSYRSLRDTVDHHMTLARSWRWWMRAIPSWPVGAEVLYWIGRRGGFDVDAVDVRAAVARLAGRPALFVCTSGDRRMPPEIAFDLKAAAGDHARVLVVPGNSHGGAWRDGTAAYERAVGEILDEAAAGGGVHLASPHEEESFLTDEKTRHVPFPEDDNGAPKAPEQTESYTMVDPRFREIYFQFYKETYKPSVLDRKTKELIAIAASLAAKCQGCLEGHVKKALKFGATREEISESIAIAIGVNAAAIVDLTDIAAENMGVKLY